MNPGIFLIQDNEDLVEMNEQAYDSEKLLQTWLAKYPALLVGGQIDSTDPRRFLLIEQECGVPSEEAGSDRWKIDHLFLDQEAIPTIVEVKRSTDTRIRREVVGQILDYAANVVAYWPAGHLQSRFYANCESCDLKAEEKLGDFLEGELEPDEFWEKADRNLQQRKMRLLFVADVIPEELRRIVEFLNDQMDQTEVLAIEIKQFVAQQGLKSLVPRVVGQTTKGRDKKPSAFRNAKKTEGSFFDEMLKNGSSQAEVELARKVLAWSRTIFSDINWGSASFSPILVYGHEHSLNPISVYTSGKRALNAKVRIRFLRMMDKNPPFDLREKRLDLLHRLNQIPGINLPDDSIDRITTIPLASLSEEQSFSQFTQIVKWIIQEVKAGKPTSQGEF